MICTCQGPALGAVLVHVASVDGPPSHEMFHSYDVIGVRSSSGVDVDVNVTAVPVTTS